VKVLEKSFSLFPQNMATLPVNGRLRWLIFLTHIEVMLLLYVSNEVAVWCLCCTSVCLTVLWRCWLDNRRHPVSVTAVCSLLSMTAWWQHAVSKPGTLLLSQEGSFLEAGEQGCSPTVTVFLTYLGSMVAACCPQLGTLLSLQEGSTLEAREKGCSPTVTVFLTYLGSMVAACCPQSGTVSSFSVLMLSVGWQEGHLACKNPCFKIPECENEEEPANLGYNAHKFFVFTL